MSPLKEKARKKRVCARACGLCMRIPGCQWTCVLWGRNSRLAPITVQHRPTGQAVPDFYKELSVSP